MDSTSENGLVEKEPLQQKQETPADTKHGQDDTEQAELSLLIQNQAPKSNEKTLTSYAIEPAYQNSTENPYRETTVTLPHLVKKVPEEDLTPQPWKTFNQVLCLSYLSVFFCLFIGMLANREAWKAKMYNGKGLYGLAQKRAKRAAILSYAAVGGGFIVIILVVLGVKDLL